MADYSNPPTWNKLDLKPFRARVPEERLQLLRELIDITPIGVSTFENTNAGRYFGTQREWLVNAKHTWSTAFDWRREEDRINSNPNFTALIKDDFGVEVNVHFMALFSKHPDAIPIAFYHGWPGSFLEFLAIFDLLKEKYPSPEKLPYHVIVPSLPGYAWSSGPPINQDYSIEQAALCMDKLMRGLGFDKYLAQGGDLGSFVARVQASVSDACVGLHLNMVAMSPPEDKDELEADDIERAAFSRGQDTLDNGIAYALMHGTRTATIGLALAANPISMLAWIGEKYLDWSDEDPSLNDILRSVSLYYLTDTYPRCIYPYRAFARRSDTADTRPRRANIQGFTDPSGRLQFIDKPFGYSFFPKELFPVPVSWAAKLANLVYYKRHMAGGHFAVSSHNPADIPFWFVLTQFYQGNGTSWTTTCGCGAVGPKGMAVRVYRSALGFILYDLCLVCSSAVTGDANVTSHSPSSKAIWQT